MIFTRITSIKSYSETVGTLHQDVQLRKKIVMKIKALLLES